MPQRVTIRATIDGLGVGLTNLDRVLWPQDGITKRDLVEYLVSMAPVILPHLRDRPLVLTRYPRGVDGESFYQKQVPNTAPAWIKRFAHRPPGGGRRVDYLLADHPAVLAWLANQAAIEIHPWLSRTGSPDRPDIAVFDLDPVEPAGFEECRPVAEVLGRALEALGVRGWLKTSGATGLHVFVPIEARWSYREVAWTAGRLCDTVHGTLPRLTTRIRRVSARPPGTVYLDHLQNAAGKTLVMPYGPRPRAGAPVSAPITWDELGSFNPTGANLRTMPGRVAALGDIFGAVTGPGRQDQDWGAVMRYLGAPS